jgi:hypothetical protein
MRPALWSVETTPWGAYFTWTKQTKQTELAKLTRIFPEKEKWKKENRSPFV